MAQDTPTLSELDGGPLENGTSLFAELEQGLAKSPHGVALRCVHQEASHLQEFFLIDDGEGVQQQQGNGHPSSAGLSLTYRQLHHGALMIAANLRDLNVRPGSTVLLLVPNGAELALLLWASTVARLTFSAVDTSILDLDAAGRPSRDLCAILTALTPSVIVVSDVNGQRAIDAAITAIEQQRSQPLLRISLGGELIHPGWTPFGRLAEKSPVVSSESDGKALEDEARHGDDPQRIHSVLFTSGTSAGRPKGCPQSVLSTVHFLRSQAWLIDAHNDAGARVLVQAHNSRAIAPALALQTWCAGGTVLMPSVTPGSSFSLDHLIDGIVQHRATFVVVSPALVHALGRRLAGEQPGALDSVRGVQLGGDAVTRDSLANCAALFPRAKVCINHGMSEGSGFFTWPFFDVPAAHIPCFGELCPIGVAAPGATVRIWDPVRQEITKRGESGELHVCCASIIAQYLGGVNPDTFYDDAAGRHWLVTGDQAMMDRQGLIFIMGRSKDMIRRANVAIMPVAIESCINKYAATQVSLRSHTAPSSQDGINLVDCCPRRL